MRGKCAILSILLMLLIVPCALAASEKQGNIKLLAVLDKGGEKSGTTANLDLELKHGSGRVFLETFPLTKVSTQVSMRFAQQIACSELDIDCSGNDFFYTIRSLPGIVGGPSAGSAAAVLAAALLLNLDLRKDAAITGTINSGGIIGAVGGLKGKIDAAAANGITLVVIPKGTKVSKDIAEIVERAEDEAVIENAENISNITTDLVEYGKKLNITVVEAATLVEALEYMSGYKAPKNKEPFVINENYKKTMKKVSVDLCSRNDELHKNIIKKRLELGIAQQTTEEEASLNSSARAKDAFNAGEYYSSASYCFKSSVELKKQLYAYKNYTQKELNKSRVLAEAKINDYDALINSKNITTITDLQTFMAVKERISDAKEMLEEMQKEKNLTEAAIMLAYAEERLYSAEAWSRFFNGKEVSFELDEERLRNSCQSKIDEAEERYNYLKVLLPELTASGVRKELDDAYSMMVGKQYITCLYTAIKAKSGVDIILGLIGVEESRFDELLNLKLDVVKQTLVRVQKKGIFPIIGYSYYEYGNSLKESDKYSALLFSEYALEFSNLDIYFPKKANKSLGAILDYINIELIVAFAAGLAIGLIVMWPVRNHNSHDSKPPQTPRKRRLQGKKR